jgi:hypothetical protein
MVPKRYVSPSLQLSVFIVVVLASASFGLASAYGLYIAALPF